MPNSLLSDEVMDDLSRRAHAFYAERLQSLLEPAHNGEFVAIHLDSEDYALGSTSSQARFALRERESEGMIVTSKIGVVDDALAYRILASQLYAGQQKRRFQSF